MGLTLGRSLSSSSSATLPTPRQSSTATCRQFGQPRGLFVHEFLTDQRRDAKVLEEHHKDLRRFSTAVFGANVPDHRDLPWCVPVPSLPEAPELRLYLAHAVTDLRQQALLHRGVHPALADVSDDDLIRRRDQGDSAACIELDSRGGTPPVFKPDDDGPLP